MRCVCVRLSCCWCFIDYYQFESMSQEIVSSESSSVEVFVALRVMVY